MVMVTSLAHALGCQALRSNIAHWMTGARVLMGSIDPGPTCGSAPRGRPSRPGSPLSSGAAFVAFELSTALALTVMVPRNS